jgi:hypothetical protein
MEPWAYPEEQKEKDPDLKKWANVLFPIPHKILIKAGLMIAPGGKAIFCSEKKRFGEKEDLQRIQDFL